MTGFFYICWIVLLLQIVLGYATVFNVALSKAAQYCGELLESKKLTDGDKDPENSLQMNTTCPPTNLTIHLGKPYSIHYIIIYPGKYEVPLQYCNISLVDRKIVEPCAGYPYKHIRPGVPIRINCRDNNKLFTEILLTPLHEDPGYANFSIAEIEVFSLALQHERYPLLHQGCYAEVGEPEAKSWENCQQTCFDGNYYFAAIKANSGCVCSNSIPEHQLRDDYECDIPCEGHGFCGGTNAFSVYLIRPPLPYYVGCLGHAHDKSGTLDESLTTIKCLRSCNDFPFFVLKYRNLCKCVSGALPKERPAGSYCFNSCVGDETQGCGSQIGMTTYRTCLRFDHLKCSSLFKCKEKYDMYGVCDEEGCQPGFSGEFCLHKDFTVSITTTTTTAPATEIATLSTTFTNQSGDADQEKTLMRKLRNYLPLIILATILLFCLLLACSAQAKEKSSTASRSNKAALPLPVEQTVQGQSPAPTSQE